jgi:hypothetical protein
VLLGTVIFLSLIVILLALPVKLTYRCSWKRTLSADVRLNWAFGLVRADVSPDLSNPEPDLATAVSRKGGWRGRTTGGKSNVLAAIRLRSFRRRILRLVSDLWSAIHKKDVRLWIRAGLGDPADTGRLWAVLGPLSGMFSRPGDISIAIEPDFLDATLELDSSGIVRVVPLQIVIIALGLLVSPAMWRGVMLMRTSG